MENIALIIGASSGVGASCLHTLSKVGFTVIGASRRIDRIQKEINKIPNDKNTHEALALDVTKNENIDKLVNYLLTKSKLPNLIVYCAGVNQYGLLQEFDKGAWYKTFSVNVKGAFDICAAFVDQLEEGSKIIIVGSTAGLKPFEGGTIYCASKAALHAFAISMREELRPKNITVSLVIPGSMNTEFWNIERPDAEELMKPDFIAKLIATVATSPEGYEISEIVARPSKEI